ncbi:MAG: excinuclease ABC subunit UvrB [Proteobacteria bacterium]|nr:excinuclease ABC subunit UvrB [Pseudomonadota bacterium]
MAELFKIASSYSPQGDQPKAIESIVKRINEGQPHTTLLGVTGSGKTFTIANVIQNIQRPALVMAPNKTLAAQLFSELKEFFPTNAVEYFISYYDYFQPEAYVPSTDTYIAKDSAINDDIDRMRHAATMSLFERRDTIIVASVSCIYGLGSPETYSKMVLPIAKGETISRDRFLRKLVDIQYGRNDANFTRGHFRVRGDVIDIFPSHQRDEIVRVEFFGDEIEDILIVDALKGDTIRKVDQLSLYPSSHYVTDRTDMKVIVKEILQDLGVRLRELRSIGKMVEYQRLEQRTMHDIELLEHLGFCPGIENYSRYLSGSKAGDPPPTLLDYFPKDFVTFIDESHITVPQIGGMFKGDRARKKTLVDFGFRLPSALDNRPLNFDEFTARTGQRVYVSATPGNYELQVCNNEFAEQIIRPTGLIDPKIEIRPIHGQVDQLYGEINKSLAKKARVLVTTLTKKMAEDLAEHYQQMGLKVRYLHSDIDSLERLDILRDLRKGVFDVLIGINLLREGLDLPEVNLVAVMDADKEGFLRSARSLIQIVGRAARNSEGRVIFFADKITDSMRQCLDETERRRSIQVEYNLKHNITPQTIIKSLPKDLRRIYGITSDADEEESAKLQAAMDMLEKHDLATLEKTIRDKSRLMQKYAGELEFEKAAEVRDDINRLKMLLMNTANNDDSSSGD